MDNQSQIATGSVEGMTQLVELRMYEYPTLTGNVAGLHVTEILGPFGANTLVGEFIK